MAYRKISILLSAVVICVVIASSIAYYAAVTTKGSGVVAELLLSKYIEPENIDYKKLSGSFADTLLYQNITVHNADWLPHGSTLTIQKLEITLTSLSHAGIHINIHNGKLKLPNSDGIFFYGNYQDARVDMSLYSNNIQASDLLDLFTESTTAPPLSASLQNVDIRIAGPLSRPEISGIFHIKKFSRDTFSIVNCPGSVNLTLSSLKSNPAVHGKIVLKNGVLSGPKTATIHLEESKILYTGEAAKPELDMKGTSQVGKVKITIALKGTFDKPDLTLTSKPAMNTARIMIMLATNNTWQSAETAITTQKLSTDLAKDFLEYFVFSGSGNKIAQKYGIHDILVKYDGQTTGIGATKDISNKTSVSYALEQQKIADKALLSHQIGTEYKITDSISIEAKKELKQNNEAEQTQKKPQTDDTIMLKFKKSF